MRGRQKATTKTNTLHTWNHCCRQAQLLRAIVDWRATGRQTDQRDERCLRSKPGGDADADEIERDELLGILMNQISFLFLVIFERLLLFYWFQLDTRRVGGKILLFLLSGGGTFEGSWWTIFRIIFKPSKWYTKLKKITKKMYDVESIYLPTKRILFFYSLSTCLQIEIRIL